jgi:hypothetical protein
MVTEPKRLLVTGSRDYGDHVRVTRILTPFMHQGITLVHGDGRGLDKLAAKTWTQAGEDALAVPADWDRYGKRAGPLRNQQMVDLGGYIACIAFPLPGSRGTWDCVRRAELADIPVMVVSAT